MIINALLESDLDDVLQIEQASFTSPWTRKMFLNELAGNPFTFLAACREESTIIGYVCYWIVFEELHMMNLATNPKYRRQGIARTLMTHVLTQARKHGAQSAMLEVRASNTPATTFYTQLGFQQIGLRKQYYADPVEDAIIMRRASLEADNASQPITNQNKTQIQKAMTK